MSEAGQKILAEVRKVAAEQPDYVYPFLRCKYMSDEGRPMCIIGHALFNLGYLPTPVPLIYEGHGVETVLDRLNIQVDMAEVYWLNKVQEAQDGHAVIHSRHIPSMTKFDRRLTWGDAIRYADGELS